MIDLESPSTTSCQPRSARARLRMSTYYRRINISFLYPSQGYKEVAVDDNEAVMEALYTKGPLAISIDAGQVSTLYHIHHLRYQLSL